MKKILLIAIIVGLLIASATGLLFWVGFQIQPGAYPNAQQYDISTDEKTLIKTIRIFKSNNPGLNVPAQLEIIDGSRKEEGDIYYHVFFYYAEENEILSAWLRSNGQYETTVAFVALNNGLTLGNWKYINKDFTKKENKEHKRKFEERILDKIKLQLEKR